MSRIVRDPSDAAKKEYDLIIIGGGIYGAMLLFEASRRELRSLLLEKGDFGEHTSFNSLRIIHGGLRYFQTLDFQRFRESVGEQRWFLQTFPDLVKPLPCLMPLYGDGLRRLPIFRVALWANHLLSDLSYRRIHSAPRLPHGRVIDSDKTKEACPFIDTKGLKGGAVWYDAFVPDSQRLLIEVLRWACTLGATALNYIEANRLVKSKQGVIGVMAVDKESSRAHEYKAPVVVNAAGPWCRDVAARFDRDEPKLFKPSLAWNVLLRKEAISDHALAVTTKRSGGRTYFLLPWKGKLLVGTGHAPWLRQAEVPMPSDEQLEEFLHDLNYTIPSLVISSHDIVHVFAGLLPATEVGSVSLATRPFILDHSIHGGPHGLYSVSGVKFTTARAVAEKTLNSVFPERTSSSDYGLQNSTPKPDRDNGRGIFPFDWYPPVDDSNWKETLKRVVEEEAVHHLDDLILRRTNLWNNPARALEIAPTICELFDWDITLRYEEIKRLKKGLIQNTRHQT